MRIPGISSHAVRSAFFILCLALAAAFLMLPADPAHASDKTVRVGWYESTFNTTDEQGRRSGYAYEYQLKLAAYTGWNYEYVNGSWSDLMRMLENGEIDLMSDVSFTEERANNMLFPTLPMGTEEYYIFASASNDEISRDDYSTLNGKKIGVNRGSVQAGMLASWVQENGVNAEIAELSCTLQEAVDMIENGTLDAYATIDTLTDTLHLQSLCKIGYSDYYFVVNKNRPDLLDELNDAMGRIQDENRYYNQLMYDRYLKQIGSSAFLTRTEEKWLDEHGAIKVGYLDNYLAFCASDKTTGMLTGALKDYLAFATGCFANRHIDFVPTVYPTATAGLEALEHGDIDCFFPANLGGYDGEMLGMFMTSPLMRTDTYAIVRQTDQDIFAKKEHVVVAVNEGNPNYDTFLLDHYPEWRKVYYPSTEECLEAVANSVADCVLVSNFRYNNIARLCERHRLVALATGEEISFSFAVNGEQTELYSILSKTVSVTPSSTVNSALAFYSTEEAKMTFVDFIMANLGIVTAAVAVVLLVILVLMLKSMRAERKSQELIAATETDNLTGLYNRDYFFQYANRMRRENPDVAMDAIVLNIEQFHSVNALNGREFGDQVLRVLGNEIRIVAEENKGIAGRFGADRFDIYCQHLDDYPAIFERLQTKLDELAPNASIRLRMGVMPWQAGLEPIQLFDRARTACSMARGRYLERLIVFDESMRDRELFEQRLVNDLNHALDVYEFEVYYQPKFDIQCNPPKLVSAEALVRWRHPEFGIIAPIDFIPLFERNGLISVVDKHVWSEAARQVARWREQYGVIVPVSVNLSRIDVFDPELEKTLDGILLQYGLEHDALKLEVTETAYTENADEVIRVVESLRNKGYQIEMDDFGTGYSSLNMLSSMPVDVLKMDRAFIRNIAHSEKDMKLVALIIDIAASLKIPVIAEGVETEEQMKLLKDLGCAMIQGFYISRPLHAADFETEFIQNMQATS